MSNDRVMEEAMQVFVEECGDLLRQVETALLRLESCPDDAEAMNSLFRAVHTIKGSAGLFGFDGVVAFAHVVESVLDRVRNGEVPVGPSLMAVLLPSCDQLERLVCLAIGEAQVADPSIDGQTAGLSQQLSGFLVSGTAGVHGHGDGEVAPGAAPTDGAAPTGGWHLSLRFGPDVLRFGMDPMSFVRYLATLGEVLAVVPVVDALPSRDQFDPESCYLGFEIRLRSAADAKTLDDVFEFVRSDCAIRILPLDSPPEAWAALVDAMPEGPERASALLAECEALAGTAATPVAAPAPVQAEAMAPAAPGAAEARAARAPAKAEESRYIRVNASKLDELITLVGEMVIAGAGANVMAQRWADAALQETNLRLSDLAEQIRECAMRLRMVQVGETFNRFHRVVRDLSAQLGKDIVLEVSGGDTELDKTVVERIADPLTHLVRNALDHGIECPDDRIAAGKAPRGTISLHAHHDSGSIVIRVGDDGKGLDSARILAKARQRGLVLPEEMPDEAGIFDLIFQPGFSTAEQVSDLSGRGVGMDVVRQNIEALRGQIVLSSRPGEGTTVTIRLPLTLAIIDGFLVQVGESVFVVPLDMVVECVELPRDTSFGKDYLDLRSQVLPFVRLRDLFEIDGERPPRESIVVVNFSGRKVGLVVDRLVGEAQAVIKPLGTLFERLDCISGSSILGTGEVALILDVPGVLTRARRVALAATAGAHGA